MRHDDITARRIYYTRSFGHFYGRFRREEDYKIAGRSRAWGHLLPSISIAPLIQRARFPLIAAIISEGEVGRNEAAVDLYASRYKLNRARGLFTLA